MDFNALLKMANLDIPSNIDIYDIAAISTIFDIWPFPIFKLIQ